MKKLFFLILIFVSCSDGENMSSLKKDSADIAPIYIPKAKIVLNRDSLNKIIQAFTYERPYLNNIISTLDQDSIIITKYSKEKSWSGDGFLEKEGEAKEEWSESYTMNVLMVLIIDRSGKILKNEIADTILHYYKPVFEEGDSSVKVDNGVEGGAEIEHFSFNTEPLKCYLKPFEKELNKGVKPNSIIISDFMVECRSENEGLAYFVHVKDKNFKNGYWILEKHGTFAHEMGGGAYWSNYIATLYLKEINKPN